MVVIKTSYLLEMLRQFIADLEPEIMLIESLDLTENNTFN